MTRSDVWRKRECVLRYRAFCDELRLKTRRINHFPQRVSLVFVIAMPASWSELRKRKTDGKPHQSKPDIDNMIKAVLDALLEDDSGVFQLHAKKFWGRYGSIEINPILD